MSHRAPIRSFFTVFIHFSWLLWSNWKSGFCATFLSKMTRFPTPLSAPRVRVRDQSGAAVVGSAVVRGPFH